MNNNSFKLFCDELYHMFLSGLLRIPIIQNLNSCCHFADNCCKMHFVLPCVDSSFRFFKSNWMFITFLFLNVSAFLLSSLCKLNTFIQERFLKVCIFPRYVRIDDKDLSFCLLCILNKYLD